MNERTFSHGVGDERYCVLIYFASYTGLRRGEIAALKVDRLNLLRGTLNVTESLWEVNGHLQTDPTKTGAHRTISRRSSCGRCSPNTSRGSRARGLRILRGRGWAAAAQLLPTSLQARHRSGRAG